MEYRTKAADSSLEGATLCGITLRDPRTSLTSPASSTSSNQGRQWRWASGERAGVWSQSARFNHQRRPPEIRRNGFSHCKLISNKFDSELPLRYKNARHQQTDKSSISCHNKVEDSLSLSSTSSSQATPSGDNDVNKDFILETSSDEHKYYTSDTLRIPRKAVESRSTYDESTPRDKTDAVYSIQLKNSTEINRNSRNSFSLKLNNTTCSKSDVSNKINLNFLDINTKIESETKSRRTYNLDINDIRAECSNPENNNGVSVNGRKENFIKSTGLELSSTNLAFFASCQSPREATPLKNRPSSSGSVFSGKGPSSVSCQSSENIPPTSHKSEFNSCQSSDITPPTNTNSSISQSTNLVPPTNIRPHSAGHKLTSSTAIRPRSAGPPTNKEPPSICNKLTSLSETLHPPSSCQSTSHTTLTRPRSTSIWVELAGIYPTMSSGNQPTPGKGERGVNRQVKRRPPQQGRGSQSFKHPGHAFALPLSEKMSQLDLYELSHYDLNWRELTDVRSADPMEEALIDRLIQMERWQAATVAQENLAAMKKSKTKNTQRDKVDQIPASTAEPKGTGSRPSSGYPKVIKCTTTNRTSVNDNGVDKISKIRQLNGANMKQTVVTDKNASVEPVESSKATTKASLIIDSTNKTNAVHLESKKSCRNNLQNSETDRISKIPIPTARLKAHRDNNVENNENKIIIENKSTANRSSKRKNRRNRMQKTVTDDREECLNDESVPQKDAVDDFEKTDSQSDTQKAQSKERRSYEANDEQVENKERETSKENDKSVTVLPERLSLDDHSEASLRPLQTRSIATPALLYTQMDDIYHGTPSTAIVGVVKSNRESAAKTEVPLTKPNSDEIVSPMWAERTFIDDSNDQMQNGNATDKSSHENHLASEVMPNASALDKPSPRNGLASEEIDSNYPSTSKPGPLSALQKSDDQGDAKEGEASDEIEANETLEDSTWRNSVVCLKSHGLHEADTQSDTNKISTSGLHPNTPPDTNLSGLEFSKKNGLTTSSKVTSGNTEPTEVECLKIQNDASDVVERNRAKSDNKKNLTSVSSSNGDVRDTDRRRKASSDKMIIVSLEDVDDLYSQVETPRGVLIPRDLSVKGMELDHSEIFPYKASATLQRRSSLAGHSSRTSKSPRRTPTSSPKAPRRTTKTRVASYVRTYQQPKYYNSYSRTTTPRWASGLLHGTNQWSSASIPNRSGSLGDIGVLRGKSATVNRADKSRSAVLGGSAKSSRSYSSIYYRNSPYLNSNVKTNEQGLPAGQRPYSASNYRVSNKTDNNSVANQQEGIRGVSNSGNR